MELFVENGQIECPKCGAIEGLRFGQIEIDMVEEELRIPIYCESCDHEWSDVYVFDRVEEHF